MDIIYVGGDTNTVKRYSDFNYVDQTASYGGGIYSIATDGTHIYVGGDITQTVRKYLKSDMSYVGQTASYEGLILSLAIDDTHIYVGGDTTNTVRKYLKSDMSYIGETAGYGDAIYSVTIDSTHIYVGGLTTNTVRKYLKSDLSYIGETASYGGDIIAVTLDDTHIYAGGFTTNTVRKYLKSDLSYIGETESDGDDIYTISLDDNHIYAGGTDNVVRKYLKSDLSYIGETASYGGDIRCIINKDDYIYVGGNTTNAVRKYLKSDLSYITQASYGASVSSIVIESLISDTISLTDNFYLRSSAVAFGEANKDTFYVSNNGMVWNEFKEFESFSINKKQNQISEFEIRLFDISPEQRVYFKEKSNVLFFCGEKMVLKGRIQSIEYGDAYEVIARGYGMECKLLDKEYISIGDNRIQFDNTSAKTIIGDINSNILETQNAGIFATDYGPISMRYEYANRLNSLGKTCESIDYNWWVSQTASDNYDLDYLNVNLTQGSTSSVKTFNLTSNANSISQTKDINNLVNYCKCLGYGDGINQISTTLYAASTQSSFLAANIASTNTSITCSSNPFNATGSVRIAEEVINYSGVTGNVLTGCTRGVSGSALSHNKNCYIEQHFPTSSAQNGSSIQTYGMMDYTLIDKTIIDLPTLEVIGSGYLSDHKTPIVSINITSDEPLTDATLNIGDLVTVTSSESGVDGTYHIVGQTYNDNYGSLEMTTEVSNRSLEFIEQMNKAKQESESMAKYMQGATNIYGLSSNEDVSTGSDQYLNMRFFVPNEAIAINKVLLNFKMRNYRSSFSHSYYSTTEDLYSLYTGSWTTLRSQAISSDTSFVHTVTTVATEVGDAFDANRADIIYVRVSDGTNYYPSESGLGITVRNDSTTYPIIVPGNMNGKTLTISAKSDSINNDYGIDVSLNSISPPLVQETLSSPSVDLYTGIDGDTMTLKDTYTADQTEIDLTSEINAIGAGNWVNLQFIPNKLMRIEANAYIQIFIKSV
jgi:hypothetical protein